MHSILAYNKEYTGKYDINTDSFAAIRHQVSEEIAMKKMMDRVDAEMLHGWAGNMDIALVHIGADTAPEKLEGALLVKDFVRKRK